MSGVRSAQYQVCVCLKGSVSLFLASPFLLIPLSLSLTPASVFVTLPFTLVQSLLLPFSSLPPRLPGPWA